MDQSEKARKEIVQHISDMLMNNGFTFEYAVKKNPKGIKVIFEVTQEQLNKIIENSKKEYDRTGNKADIS